MMHPELIPVLLLAVVQGLTEFLPVSSSGHLVIMEHLTGIKEGGLFVAVILHGGTLASILVYYYQDIAALIISRSWRSLALVVVGTIPAGIAGLLIKPMLDRHFSSLWIVGFGLITTGVILLRLHRRNEGRKTFAEMNAADAILIGLVQCVAILPGVSRSGSTISAATRLGFDHATSARFSFYLAIPAIAGANILLLRDTLQQHGTAFLQPAAMAVYGTGFAVAFVIGYIALKTLIHTLKRRTFAYFGYYCLAAALCVLLYCAFVTHGMPDPTLS